MTPNQIRTHGAGLARSVLRVCLSACFLCGTHIARGRVLYWFTAETYALRTTFKPNAQLPADIGFATTQIADGTETISSGPDASRLTNCAESYAIQVVAAPDPVSGRPGTKAVRFEVRRGDYKFSGHRAELSLPHAPSGGVFWYAWSVYVPHQLDEKWDEILGQLHADDAVPASPPWAVACVPFSGLSRDLKGGGKESVLAWAFYQEGGAIPPTLHTHRISDVQVDTWVDWVVQVNWARDNRGWIKVWKDGAEVLDLKSIATDYAASHRWPYFKFGIYRWPWKQTDYTGEQPTSVAYFDEIKVGDASESYDSMAPRGWTRCHGEAAQGTPRASAAK